MALLDLQKTSNPISDEERAAALADPGFGRYCTDHMALANYTEGKGWRIRGLFPPPTSASTPVKQKARLRAAPYWCDPQRRRI